MPVLLIHRIDDETQIIKLDKKNLTLGRLENNDVVIDDIFVSRYHAEVIKRGTKFVIRDRNSRYGTFVNGEKIEERFLNYGDEIQVGNTLITFVDEKKLQQLESAGTSSSRTRLRVDLIERINSLEQLLVKGGKKEELLRSVKELKSSFIIYQRKLAEAEKSKEVADTLCEVAKIINFVFDLNVLLNLLMDLALKIVRARRGFIMLYNEKEKKLHIKVARNMGSEIEVSDVSDISGSIARTAFEKATVVTTDDAKNDERFKNQPSVVSYAIGAVVCAPLIAKKGGRIGVLYLDNPIGQRQFDRYDINFISSFANEAAIAIENARLYEKAQKEERLRNRLQRFFSPSVVKKIMTDEKSIALGGEYRTATILFCDIRGYTSFTEKIDPFIAVQILNDFLSAMTEVVFKYEGTLDKYIGDCVMAIFGAPVSHNDDPLRAIKAALDMKKEVIRLKQEWQKKHHISEIDKFEIGIGINTGEVIAGNIGNINRMEYTVVSAAVNLASRLENIAQPGQILISKSTYELTRDDIVAKHLHPVQLKNISQAVEVYDVRGLIS